MFLLQIVEASAPHRVVQMPGGGPLERAFIESCTDAIVSRGVGLLRTEAQVKQAIREGITEVIRELKYQTVAVVKR